jgi:DNA processing protein
MSALPLTIAPNRSISPLLEMGAYEALWSKKSATFKTIADLFRARPNAVPSSFVQPEIAEKFAQQALGILERAGVSQFGVRVYGAGEYPDKLRDARNPVELLYFQGWWNLVETRSVAVVGTRKPSKEGEKRCARLVELLVRDGFTIVSGLARGIDRIAHETTIKNSGIPIAVIGTPLSDHYPPENSELQDFIAKTHLLISQIPICRYASQGPLQNRLFFPERNITMSALTEATIIVEAGETSGTLTQARAAIDQGRKLFILDSCFLNPQLTWPKRFQDRGAIRVKEYEDIRRNLAP